jgi:hypothetical protein
MLEPSPETVRRLQDCEIYGNIDAFLGYVEDGRAAADYERILKDVWDRDCRWLKAQAGFWGHSSDCLRTRD